jgi:restriction system protein
MSVTETAPGPDGGIDLALRKDGELHLVQCKHWRARKVGVEIVRELYGVMAARGAVGSYVVSSGVSGTECPSTG